MHILYNIKDTLCAIDTLYAMACNNGSVGFYFNQYAHACVWLYMYIQYLIGWYMYEYVLLNACVLIWIPKYVCMYMQM